MWIQVKLAILSKSQELAQRRENAEKKKGKYLRASASRCKNINCRITGKRIEPQFSKQIDHLKIGQGGEL